MRQYDQKTESRQKKQKAKNKKITNHKVYKMVRPYMFSETEENFRLFEVIDLLYDFRLENFSSQHTSHKNKNFTQD